MSKKYDYDAIIIGAGISGLVCGCYLAKAGMKTLIVEKNAKPGGYCTSFTRGGFLFDACVHSVGSLREGGYIDTILKELELENRIKVRRFNPSDIIVTPDFKIKFWNDFNETVREFSNCFPGEATNINNLFKFLISCEGTSLISLRSITFGELLDKYLNDNKLKAILSLPLLGNAGLTASKISAVTGVTIYKEFMFDGGYYPGNSIQSLADLFIRRYTELGGDVHFSTVAKKIKTEMNKVSGVELGKENRLSAKYVISNADASQTMLKLLGEEIAGADMVEKLNTLEPSLSMFVLYLGVNDYFTDREFLIPGTNMWYLPNYDVDNIYNLTVDGDFDKLDWFIFRYLSEHDSAIMLVNAPFKKEEYWKDNKERLMDVFLTKLERIFPGLSSHIGFKDAATPNTLRKWTLNYKGAAYGWAWSPSQYAVTGLTQNTNIKNLYLTGHWTTLFQGVAGVAYLGRDISNKILKKDDIS